jgi:tRNA nucleotidyltransferase/poly(A) polymerase
MFNTPIEINDLKLLELFITLRSMSPNNYIVGGAVRDLLIGRKPKDFDIVTDTQINTIGNILSDNGWKTNVVGQRFLVLSVSKEGSVYEIANFRRDSIGSDGRRPDFVEVGTIQDDAARRDFTVNALFLNPMTMELVDPNGSGLSDLRDMRLRFVGNPAERIEEDFSRVFRFYVMKAKGFVPDRVTERVVRELFPVADRVLPAEVKRNFIETLSNMAL